MSLYGSRCLRPLETGARLTATVTATPALFRLIIAILLARKDIYPVHMVDQKGLVSQGEVDRGPPSRASLVPLAGETIASLSIFRHIWPRSASINQHGRWKRIFPRQCAQTFAG